MVMDMENIDKKYCVYLHTNKINYKVYVGQTCQNPNARWNNGNGYKTCTYFYHAIQKYGWDNFEHIIFADNLTKAEADCMERMLIALYHTNSAQYGYNLTDGGEGVAGYKMTAEQKQKISNALKNHRHSEETKQKIRDANIGRRHTTETKQKLSIKRRKENLSEDTRKKLSENAILRYADPTNNPFYGKTHTDDVKLKLSCAAKERLTDKENHPLYGKHHKEETIDKLKESSHRQGVVQLLDGVIIATYNSMRDAERQTGIGHSHISNCCKGTQKSAGGFQWEYEGR